MGRSHAGLWSWDYLVSKLQLLSYLVCFRLSRRFGDCVLFKRGINFLHLVLDHITVMFVIS